jgi:7,8-dihydropterin-6-yl-methyl-4-(beta-D-ribofuranosyl)aminobenzene 5'-phosphate synthase
MSGPAAELRELDLLSVTVVVDNITDMLSQPCNGCDGRAPKSACHYTSEINKIVADFKGSKVNEIDFHKICYAGHGLSLYIVGGSEGKTHTLLFDGGPNGPLWQHNMESLGLSAAGIDAVVLSHW